jgi:hypothetical protein
MHIKIPFQSSYYTSNAIIITGVGRSGTSILGKLIGSMRNTVYLYEPIIMKYAYKLNRAVLRTILFEDYILPTLQYRGNTNDTDDSFMGHYCVDPERKLLRRRLDAIRYYKNNKIVPVIKSNECQHLAEKYRKIFPKSRIVHIVRNRESVVKSALLREWYTDKYLKTMIEPTLRFAPVFIRNPIDFKHADTRSRVEMVYDDLLSYNYFYDLTIKYEELCANPEKITMDIASSLNLQPSEKTHEHIKKIKNHTDINRST